MPASSPPRLAFTGWNCLFTDAGPDVIEACLPSPLIGLAVRWWWRRRRAVAV